MPPRDDLQGLCLCLDPNHILSLLLFLFYLLFGRFIELVRDAMPYLYFGLIFVLASRARLAVRNLHLDKDDPSEIHHKSYSKVKSTFVVGVYSSYSNWLVCLISLSQTLCSASSLNTFWDNLFHFDKTLPLLILSLGIGAIFGTMTYAFYRNTLKIEQDSLISHFRQRIPPSSF